MTSPSPMTQSIRDYFDEAAGNYDQAFTDTVIGRAERDAWLKQMTAAVKSLDLALHGGEDYELLFTVPARKANRVPRRFRGVPLQQIGEISARKEVVLVGADGRSRALEPAGYDHFRPSCASP